MCCTPYMHTRVWHAELRLGLAAVPGSHQEGSIPFPHPAPQHPRGFAHSGVTGVPSALRCWCSDLGVAEPGSPPQPRRGAGRCGGLTLGGCAGLREVHQGLGDRAEVGPPPHGPAHTSPLYKGSLLLNSLGDVLPRAALGGSRLGRQILSLLCPFTTCKSRQPTFYWGKTLSS